MKKEKSRVVGNIVVPSSTVETPPHIAELMRDLVGVNKDSVLLDLGAGRGALTKDARCFTIAVEHDERFKVDLVKVVDVVIIDDTFKVDGKRIEKEVILNFPIYDFLRFWREIDAQKYSREELSDICLSYFTKLQKEEPVTYAIYTQLVLNSLYESFGELLAS